MSRRTSGIEELVKFVQGSPESLLQVLVAAADRDTFARIIECPRFPTAVDTPDLASALQALQVVLKSSESSPAAVLAELYVAAFSKTHRKEAGQFFTPAEVARWGLSFVAPTASDGVLDAGAGTGVFGEALVRLTKGDIQAYIGIENDALLVLSAAHTLEAMKAPRYFRVWYKNYLMVSAQDLERLRLPFCNIVISNPPFVRSQNLRGRAKLLGAFGASLGIKLSSMSGASSYFLCQAVYLLGDSERALGARGARRMFFFLPKEALGAAYARELRKQLQLKHRWLGVEYHIPKDLLQDADLGTKSLALGFLFERTKEGGDFSSDPLPSRSASLGSVVRIRRGISTGKNDFFVLREEDVRQRCIASLYLKPILPTRVPIPGVAISYDDWRVLRDSGHPCWLLSIPEELEVTDLAPPVQAYLKEGLRRGLHATATAQRLRKWYSIPLPSRPPDMFVTYLFRGAPRFILNEVGVYHLTNILGGEVRSAQVAGSLDRSMIESLNSAARAWFAAEGPGRQYRDGLMKIEPRELEKLPVSPHIWNGLGGSGAVSGSSRSLFD